MSHPQDIELERISTTLDASRTSSGEHHQDDNTTGHEIPQLPPTDKGLAAWRMLLISFTFEALFWGFPLSFGVFQNYYSQLPQFANDPFIAVVGTTASGISYLAAPLIIPLIKKYSKWRTPMIWFGWILCILGLVAGSFAKSLATLIVTQGVMYGVGFTIFYYPILSMVNEYWIARRGLAYGILCAASGVSGAAMPFCVDVLLHRYGYATTLRAVAIGLFVLTAPMIPFLKGRAPEEGSASKTNWSFLRSTQFWAYNISNFAMGLGFFFPSLYLPSYASAQGMSSTHGALLLAIMSVSQVLGQMSFGYLSDGKLPINLLAFTSTLIAGAAVYGCWGVAHTFAVLAVFSLFYGFFGAGYTALWGRMGTAVTSEPTGAFAAFGCLNFGKGVGNIVAGPLGGALLQEMVHLKSYGIARYESVILFTGSCMVVSSATVLLCYWKKVRI